MSNEEGCEIHYNIMRASGLNYVSKFLLCFFDYEYSITAGRIMPKYSHYF